MVVDKFMDLKNLSIEELVKQISPSSSVIQELTRRGVIRKTKRGEPNRNYTGNIGEYFAIEFYNNLNLNLYKCTRELPKLKREEDENSQDIDAKSESGDGYSIKTVSSPSGTTGSFWDPEAIESNIQKFKYLIIPILDKSFQVDKILELTWDEFIENKKYNKRMQNYNISLTKTIVKKFVIISKI